VTFTASVIFVSRPTSPVSLAIAKQYIEAYAKLQTCTKKSG